MAASTPPAPSLSISGITLASLIHLVSTSPCDASGLLSGHLTVPPLSCALSDYDQSPSVPSTTPPPLLITNVHSFPSPFSFFTPIAQIDPYFISNLITSGSSPVIGWFSYRRNTSQYPSMRDLSVSRSLAKTLENDRPFIFLLLSDSFSSNMAVHTHEYRAYVLNHVETQKPVLAPISLKVINVGPSTSAGQYGNFSPELSVLPAMPCVARKIEDGDVPESCSSEGEKKKKSKKGESLGAMKEKMQEQKILDFVTQGFGVDRLERLVSGPANSYTNELEDLYCNMLNKFENLAKQVEQSSISVAEQENRNLGLRCKLAGML